LRGREGLYATGLDHDLDPHLDRDRDPDHGPDRDPDLGKLPSPPQGERARVRGAPRPALRPKTIVF
jgi:hypothetical protein